MKPELSHLRTWLAAHHHTAFILPRSDAYLGEYVAASDERLAWLTGFTGSAGFAVVTADAAWLYTDGRYQTQGAAEIQNSGFTLRHSQKNAWHADLMAAHPNGGTLAYDPWLLSMEWVEQAQKKFSAAAWTLVAVSENPVDALWMNRPAPPSGKMIAHPLPLAGETSANKCARLAEKLRTENIVAEFVNDPTLAAWLLNLRGTDLEFTPIVHCRAMLHASGQVECFIAPEKISGRVQATLEGHISFRRPHEMAASLAALAGQRVRLPPANTPHAVQQMAEASGVIIDTSASVVIPARAIKNAVEISGMRAAHARDGEILTRLYAELPALIARGGVTEHDIAMHIMDARKSAEHYAGESFPAIVGWNANGAIVHYRAPESGSAEISGNGILLIDCGAQYRDGTTDITRTLAIGTPTQRQREIYTRVLKGHLAIARAVFPVGTTGGQLDALARQFLWEAGLDYDHGTGHGVGSFLSVHEGPQRITNRPDTVALQPGMILSNEPGCYIPGEFGVRIENLVVVMPAAIPGFLCFETLTHVPYDRALMDKNMLAPNECWQIKAYQDSLYE